MARLWWNAGLVVEGRYWIERALPRVSEAEHPDIAGRLQLALSSLLSGQRSFEAAQRAAQLYESVGDLRSAAHAQYRRAFALYQMGRLDEAREATIQALATSRTCTDAYVVTHPATPACLNLLAGLETVGGDFRAGRELYAQALAAYKALGDERLVSSCLTNMAELEFAEGDSEQALGLANEGLEIDLRGRNAMNIARDYNNIAAYRIALDNLDGSPGVGTRRIALCSTGCNMNWILSWLSSISGCLRHSAAIRDVVRSCWVTWTRSTTSWVCNANLRNNGATTSC